MLKELTKVCRNTWNLFAGEVSLYPKPVVLHEFKSAAELKKWQIFTDATFGGRTTASLEYCPDSQAAVFEGQYFRSAEDAEGALRYGYCGISTKVTAIGDVYDLDQYAALKYKVRGDGRTYIANLRLDNFTGQATDVWQVPFRTVAGEWQEVTIAFSSFVPTKQGRLFRTPLQLVRGKIISLGLALAPWDFHPLPLQGARPLPVAGGPVQEGAPAVASEQQSGSGFDQQQQQRQQPQEQLQEVGGGTGEQQLQAHTLQAGQHAQGGAGTEGTGDGARAREEGAGAAQDNEGDEDEDEDEEGWPDDEQAQEGMPFRLEVASIMATGVAQYDDWA